MRRGLVRCGHCGVVFNAYDTLLAELVSPPEDADSIEDGRPPVPEPPDELVPERVFEPPPAPRVAAEHPPAARPSPNPDQEPAADRVFGAIGEQRPQPAHYLPDTQPHHAPTARETGTAAADRPPPTPGLASLLTALPRATETSESILLSELPTRMHRPAQPKGPRFYLQALAALMLAGILVLQTALFLRGELAAALPGTRPLLQALCSPLACQVPLPRLLDKSAIAASALEHDRENKSREHLTILLANRSGQIQEWPHIVLILTDVRDAPVAQRIFTPGEYLKKGTRVEAGMAANAELEIRLDLDTGTLAATGYALDLTYH